MLLSLLQTPDRVDPAAESLTDAFVPIVKACATSRVWKVRFCERVGCANVDSGPRQIRDAAGDALTGLISPMDVPSVCTSLLDGVEQCAENEVGQPYT